MNRIVYKLKLFECLAGDCSEEIAAERDKCDEKFYIV
jgi:hypothetical protein